MLNNDPTTTLLSHSVDAGCDFLTTADEPGQYVASMDGQKMTGTLAELEANAYALLSMVSSERLRLR